MSGDAKRPQRTFELKAGPTPALKPAAAPQPADPNEPESGQASQPADDAARDCLPQKSLILRLVETVKAL